MVRNQLYRQIGPAEARRFLASLFPNGTVGKEISDRLNIMKEDGGLIEEAGNVGVVEQLVNEILSTYALDPNSKSLPILKRA